MSNTIKIGSEVVVVDDAGQDPEIEARHRLTEGDVRRVEAFNHHGYLKLEGNPHFWLPDRFRKARKSDLRAEADEPAAPHEEGDRVLVWATVDGRVAGRDVLLAIEAHTGAGEGRTVWARADHVVRPREGHEYPEPPAPEPGGKYAMVRSGRMHHTRHGAGGKWQGSDGKWRTWEQVRAMATRANDPKTLMTDEEGTRA